jgi:hypothetical protein
MSQGITRAELDASLKAFGDSFMGRMASEFKALRCPEHDERITGLAAKARDAEKNAQEAYTVAQVAKVEAESAKESAVKVQGDLDKHKTDLEAHGARAVHKFGATASVWVCTACTVLMVVLTYIQIKEAKLHEYPSQNSPAAAAPAHSGRR